MTELMELQTVETKYKTQEGETVHNISLKTRVNKDGSVMQGLMDGKHIIIEKIFAKGYENKKPDYTSYSVRARYNGKVVSFMLYEKDHIAFEAAGGEGDLVKISGESYKYQANGKENVALGLKFEKVLQ